MINIVVVEDNETIREGLRILIDSTKGYGCVAEYSNCDTMLKSIKKLNPDVLLIDIGLPGMNGIEGIKQVKVILPELIILVLTIYEENELIFEALCAGASGYIVKRASHLKLMEAIKEGYQGGTPMSSNIARKVIELFQQKRTSNGDDNTASFLSQERDILNKLIEGNSIKAIADSLSINEENVRNNFKSIYKKLHLFAQKKSVAKIFK